MGELWRKMWIWIRISVWVAIVIYLVAFVVENHGREAIFWVFPYKTLETTSLTLSLLAFIAGIIATLLIQTTVRTLRHLRDASNRSSTYIPSTPKVDAQEVPRVKTTVQTDGADGRK
jgi:ABC-type Fe3+ transport system permease subunit